VLIARLSLFETAIIVVIVVALVLWGLVAFRGRSTRRR
jgi:hypothetical protein